jgi:uncharacterized protein (TIGR04255 family)
MTHNFRYPPIEEALCEIQLAEEDSTLPGMFKVNLNREKYPHTEKRCTREYSLTNLAEGTVEHQVRTIDFAVFLSPDKKQLVQVSPSIVSVNVLKPYCGWEEFLQNIQNMISIISEYSESKNAKRIGLRYIIDPDKMI